MTPTLLICAAWSAALAAAVALLPGRPEVGAVALAAAVVGTSLLVVVRPLLVPLALIAALLGVARAELPAADGTVRQQAAAFAGRSVTAIGRVADDPRPSPGGYQVLIDPALVAAEGAALPRLGELLVRVRGPGQVAFGDEVQASGRLVPPADLPGFDRRAYLAQRGVYLEMNATAVTARRRGGGLTALPSWLRDRYREAITTLLPAPHAALLVAFVLGIRTGIPAGLDRALIATGLIHLLVLSGLKVAVFGRLVMAALTPAMGRAATWPALALIGGYALAGGATPAAVRAAAMGGLALLATRLGRSTHVWTSLAVAAAAMLGWHPELAWDVGFQLSFVGTAAIVLLTPRLERRLRGLPQPIREPLAVTCAAQVGTLPLAATDFHVISPVAPIANALILPALPAMVAAGLLIAPFAGLPALGRLLAMPVAGLLMYLEQLAAALARLPGAAISITAFPGWLALAYYACLGGAVVAARSERRSRWMAVTAMVLAPLVIAGAELALAARASPEVVVMAVGDGQAVLVSGPHGQILIDGGPSPGRLTAGLGTDLPPWQHSLDALIVTAPTLAHVGGLAALPYTAGEVIVPRLQLAGSSWRTVVLAEVTRGARLWTAGAGDVLSLAGLRVEVLAPEPGDAGDVPGEGYLAIRVVGPGGRSFCDMSDLGADSQAAALTRLPGGCDYLLLPSEGRSAPAPALLEAFPHAQLIVSSSGGRLVRGLPLGRLRRTDQEGPITLPL
ncbi:MAG: ComEC/Rec2 family competence protein [Candidatus Dormibacteraceae bacterium]